MVFALSRRAKRHLRKCIVESGVLIGCDEERSHSREITRVEIVVHLPCVLS